MKGFWSRTTLANLGLDIHLGHNGQPCPKFIGQARQVCIVGLRGVQQANIKFCKCGEPEYMQLLQVGLWAASWQLTRTAFTLQALEHFGKLTTQGSVSAQDFVKTLVRETDGVLPHTVQVRDRSVVFAAF